jgi:hypothetical protein
VKYALAVALLTIVSFACSAAEQGPLPIRLREAAVTAAPTIYLSDLLPEGVPEPLRRQAASVVLGSAPQPGSVRVLGAREIVKRMKRQGEWSRQLSVPQRIYVRGTGWLIVRDAVDRALRSELRRRGWAEDLLPQADSLEWPRSLVAREEAPVLEVTRVGWNPNQPGIAAHLRCVNRADCGEFMVTAPAPEAQAAAWQKQVRASRLGPRRSSRANVSSRAPILARAGSRAILMVDDRGMRISVPVRCLERGSFGQRIRVRQIYPSRLLQAEVVGVGLLKTSLADYRRRP